MKKSLVFFAILTMMALGACSDHVTDHENLSESAGSALDLYYKYADNEHLTVAYLGDLVLDGKKIDALMIQADLDEDWNRLKKEFGMMSEPAPLGDTGASGVTPTEGGNAVSMGVEINADFMRELGLDTITDPGQVDSTRFIQLKEIVAGKIRDIVNRLSVADTSLPDMEAYIDTLAYEVATQLLSEVMNGPAASDSTRVEAGDYGHPGYVSAADNGKRILWLFFYDNQEECNVILTHIREDIVVQQQ